MKLKRVVAAAVVAMLTATAGVAVKAATGNVRVTEQAMPVYN